MQMGISKKNAMQKIGNQRKTAEKNEPKYNFDLLSYNNANVSSAPKAKAKKQCTATWTHQFSGGGEISPDPFFLVFEKSNFSPKRKNQKKEVNIFDSSKTFFWITILGLELNVWLTNYVVAQNVFFQKNQSTNFYMRKKRK